MSEEDPVDVLPSDFDLREALYRAATGIEEKFLVTCLDQYTRTEAVHHRRRVSCTEERYAYVLTKCGARKGAQ
ncbi:hypothetical protein ACVWWO_007549 [Bradyrhizobium sp. F1.13.1]